VLSLDATTRAAYDLATSLTGKAQAVLTALGSSVTVVVYDGSGTVKGSGTMAAPWAVASGAVLTIGEVQSFAVTSSGTPDAATWYLRFEGAGRWVRGSFGPGGSFTWSLGTWEAGQTGSIGTATATVPSSSAQADLIAAWAVQQGDLVFGWTIPDAPYTTSAYLANTAGQTLDTSLHAYDPQDVGVYSLLSQTKNGVAFSGFAVNSATGVISVPANLAAASGSDDLYAVTVDLAQAAQVTGLTASVLSDTSVYLTWNEAAGATGYTVERSLNGSTWQTVTPAVAVNTQDLLVLYTTKALTRLGTVAAMRAQLDASIRVANKAYADSKVDNLRVRVIGFEASPLQESNTTVSATLNLLTANTAVKTRRNAIGADHVLLISDDPSGGGTGAGSSSWATVGGVYGAPFTILETFAVVRAQNVTADPTVVHEIGHMQGLQHDRQTDGGGVSGLYHYGYRNCVTNGSRDIMSYACTSGVPAPQVAMFSNPTILVNGLPLGVDPAVSPATAAYAARSLRELAAPLANFRSPLIAVPPPVTQIDSNLTAGTTYFYRVRSPASTSNTVSVTTTGGVVGDAAEADWQLRSNYAGVVWAHDFRYAAEGPAFLDILDDLTQIDTTARPPGYTTGAAMTHFIPGNPVVDLVKLEALTTTTARVTTATPAEVDLAYPYHDEWVRICGTWGDTAVSNPSRWIPAPLGLLHDERNGGGGETIRWKVIAIHSPTVFDIETSPSPSNQDDPVTLTPGQIYFGQTDGTVMGTDKVQRARVAQGGWTRPFSAVQSGNGLPFPDRGLTASEFTQSSNPMPPRTYPTWSVTRDNRWRKDYWGHERYAAGLDTWPDYINGPQSDMYRGSDFWLQWRVRVDGSRYQDSNEPIRNWIGLKWIGIWNAGSTPPHEVVWSDLNVQPCPPASGTLNENLPASAGGFVGGYTNGSSALKFYADSGAVGTQMQRGGDFVNCKLGANVAWSDEATDCFRIPPDEWVVFLLHVIPGQHHPTGSPGAWPTVADASKGTAIQLWGATQSRIDAMRNAGQAPTYQCIYNKIGVTAFPFKYSNVNVTTGEINVKYDVSPPAFNEVRYWAYQNFIPQVYAYRRAMTQMIFKKGSGLQNQDCTTTTFNPHIDGIPCPRY
jgi:hypothetical protein